MTKLRAAYRIGCGKLWKSSCLGDLLIAIDYVLHVRQIVLAFLDLEQNVTVKKANSSMSLDKIA
jgi:hypothetical protein